MAHGVMARSVGRDTIATAQVSVATTATKIADVRPGRDSITVVTLGTTDVYLGPAGVTTSTGILLTGSKGASVTLSLAGALYGIVGAGTQTVSVAETY